MGELATPTMNERDAEKLTERIRITAHNYADARQKLQELVQQAKDGGAHLALGYKSWTAYLAEVLGEEPMRLARGERQEMVRMLSDEGMSTRAIAPIVGAARNTVMSDMRQVAQSEPVDNAPTPRVVESLDGRTRTYQPAQFDSGPTSITNLNREPRRKALTDTARETGWELRKAAEKLQQLMLDDRYSRNKEEVAANLRGHLMFTVEVCQDLLDNIDQ